MVTSLAAKPFLILAGLSGSGKTLLAIAISKWLSANNEQVQVVAVGSDWTSTHHLLGYPDALHEERYIRTPALDLILRASNSPKMPFFLILDEMNLSHVERYFSDILSAMESSESISLHGAENDRAGVAPKVQFPKNLFVIGTINVDETTYMFSPKVIDRANVIEFAVSEQSMKDYLAGNTEFSPSGIQGMGAIYGASLVDFVGAAATLDQLDEDRRRVIEALLLGLFTALDDAGLQFGFRTAREMIRYAVANQELLGPESTPLSVIDAQIAQRLLPRLSGDAGKLRPILAAVLSFCSIAEAATGRGLERDLISSKSAEIRSMSSESMQGLCKALSKAYPLTADKVRRLLERLAQHGFATSIEA